MINTDQENYFQVISDVSKHLSLILKQTNKFENLRGNGTHSVLVPKNANDENCPLSSSIDQLIIKRVFISKEASPVNEYEEDSVIYDEVTDRLPKSLENEYEYLNANKKNPIVLFTKQKGVTLNDRLRKSQPIWYLPNTSVLNIKNRLQHSEIGNFILTKGPHSTKSLVLIENLCLYVLIEKNTVNHFSIQHNNKQFFMENHPDFKFDAIIPLIAHYITEKPILGNLKLVLPLPIKNAISLHQLNSISLLEQDFWIKGFSTENDQGVVSEGKLQVKESEPKSIISSIYSSTPFIHNAIQLNKTIKELNTTNKQISFSSSLIQIPVVSKTQHVNNNIKNKTKITNRYLKRFINNNNNNNNSSNRKEDEKNLFLSSAKEPLSAATAADDDADENSIRKKRTNKIESDKKEKNSNDNNCQAQSGSTQCKINTPTKSSSKLSSVIIASSNRLFKKRFHSLSLDQLSYNSNINSNKTTESKPNPIKLSPDQAKKVEEVKEEEEDEPESLSSSSFVPNSSAGSFKFSSTASLGSTTATCTDDSSSIKTNLIKQTKFKWPHKLLDKKFRSNLTLGEQQKQQQHKTDTNNAISNDLADPQKKKSSKTNARSITDFLMGIFAQKETVVEENNTKAPAKKSNSFLNSLVRNKKLKTKMKLEKNFLDSLKGHENSSLALIPRLPFTNPPSLESDKAKLLEEHYTNVSSFYSSYPGIRCASQAPTNRKYRQQKPRSNRLSNEYSEPFDYLMLDASRSFKGSHLSTFTLPMNRIKKLQAAVKVSKDDSAYYSSSCQSSQSTPKINNKILEKSECKLLDIQSSSFDNDKLDSNSDAKSPALTSASALTPKLAPNGTKIIASGESSETDFDSSTSSPLMTIFKHSTPIFLNRKYTKSTTMPLVSEYESVRDSLIKDYEKRLDLQNSFKSTITAFDVLSDRCAELIGLFDSDTEQTSFNKQNKLKEKHSKIRESSLSSRLCKQDVTCLTTAATAELFPLTLSSKYAVNSRFLERTLSFNNFMSSSVLLTSFNDVNRELSIDSNTVTDQESVEQKANRNFDSIRCYIFKLAKNGKSIFGKSINEFISCSTSSKELNPYLLTSNIRQFMNGMKNYLMNKNDLSNKELKNLIEKERENLGSGEIINIDWILEDCMQSIVLRQLKSKIYYLIVDWLINDGSLISTNKNIKYINSLDETKCIEYLNLTKVEHKPSNETLNLLRNFYNRMQCEYAPLVKLKYILFMVNELLAAASDSCVSLKNNDFYLALQDVSFLNVVEFMPILIYSMCKCNMSAIQIEIDYIWSLVNRQLLNNECIYYLHLMSSACFILKSLDLNQLNDSCKSLESMHKFIKQRQANSVTSNMPSLSYMEQGLIEIYLIDNFKTINIKAIPVKPGSKCKEVNMLIASKFKVFNCDEYALYFVENNIEKKLKDDDQPLEMKIDRIKNGTHVKFVYKQKLSNIVTKYY